MAYLVVAKMLSSYTELLQYLVLVKLVTFSLHLHVWLRDAKCARGNNFCAHQVLEQTVHVVTVPD